MKKALLIILTGLLFGCSTQKNTLVSRTYHNTTARYNFLFNAKESYNEITAKYSKEFPFAYNSLLPVFLFSDKLAPSKTAEGMDRAILKSGMLIKYHSITAKPKTTNLDSPSKRAFYNQREFCKYVDDAYLYIAIGNAYLHEYSKSRQSIDQILLNYPNSNTTIDAQIWQGVVAGADGDLILYADALNTATQFRNLTKKQSTFLRAAWADYYIKNNDYPKAIESLKQATTLESNKTDRTRYLYILGQLYQLTNKRQQAAAAFHEVAKKASSYEMTFNAQLDEARSYTAGSTSNLKNLLIKMAKSERNSPYRDQIYYTIGKIYQQDKNDSEALSYFAKSLEYSAPSSNQKGVTFATLADMAYNKKNFLIAQSYYDSATNNLDRSHPIYLATDLRAQKLGRLAQNMREYQRLDSLLKMGEMSELDLNKLIDKNISQLTTKQNKAQEESNLQRQSQMNQNSLSLNTNQSGSWYFYNQSTLAFGSAEFRMRWGQRKLEDSWRRKNKGTLDQLAEEQKTEEKKKEDKLSPLTREFYLKDIPKSADDKQKLIEQKQTTLVDVAEAYRADIEEPNEAINTLNGLMPEQLSKLNELKTYTTYYLSYLMLNDINGIKRYKELILDRFPRCELAQSFGNSNISTDSHSSTSGKSLDECVVLLNTSKFNECLVIVNQQIKDSTSVFAPQFALVKAMAIGGLQGKEAYRKELANVMSRYPNSEASRTASDYLSQFDSQTLESLSISKDDKSETTLLKKQSITKYIESEGEHVAIIIIPNKMNFNQLKFNLVSLNLESVPNQELGINKQPYDNENDIVVIGSFDSKKKATDYYYQLIQKQNMINQSGSDTFAIFAISNENLELLLKDKTLESYADFFMSKYIK